MGVLFDRAGRCPACGKGEGEEVTEADRARAASAAVEHAERLATETRGPQPVGRDRNTIVGGVVLVALGLGLSFLSYFSGGTRFLFYGLVVVGIARIIRGYTGRSLMEQ